MQHRVLTSAIVWIPSGKLELIRREASHGVCGVHQDGMGIGPRFPFSFFLVFFFFLNCPGSLVWCISTSLVAHGLSSWA